MVVSKLIVLYTLLSLVSYVKSTIQCGVFHEGVGFAYNAKEAGRYEHPWKAAVMKLSENRSDFDFICGGIIIDEETIVTAAHCLSQINGKDLLPRDIVVLLGAHRIDKRGEPGQSFHSAKTIHIHENWNPGTKDFDGDIALIKLTEKTTFNSFIRPICLPTLAISDIVNGTVVGWGAYNDYGVHSNYPRKIDIQILDPRDCIRRNRGLSVIFGKQMFCAGAEGTGVCGGDSGSGYYVKVDGVYFLRGIVSSSVVSKCSDANYALYSDVLENLEFIRKFTKISVTNTKPVRSGIEDVKVSAGCGKVFQFLPASSCIFQNLKITTPNTRIERIFTTFNSGDSDVDVSTLIIGESNLSYLPTFDEEYLARKFKNLKRIMIHADNGTVPLTIASSADGQHLIPEKVEILGIKGFKNRLEYFPSNFISSNTNLKGFGSIGNDIQEIPRDFLKHNVNLEEFVIVEGYISSFPVNMLQTNEELKKLIFQNNRITQIPDDFLVTNLKLEIFSFQGNFIKSLPGNLFKNNQRLKVVNISDNKLKTLPVELLRNAYEIHDFFAAINNINEVPQNFFSNSKEMVNLYLNENLLKTIPEDMLSGMKELKNFSLDHNEIELIPSKLFRDNYNLENIALSFNRISSLSENFLKDTTKLKIFAIGANNIAKLPPNLLGHATSLQIFSAERNVISEIPSKFFSQNSMLHFVFLAKNIIKALPSDLLQKIPSLLAFSASENQIESIPSTFFQNNGKLERVSLYQNKITLLPENLFMKNSNLKIISIWGNKMQSLPPKLISYAPLLEEFYYEFADEKTKEPLNFRQNNPILKNITFCGQCHAKSRL